MKSTSTRFVRAQASRRHRNVAIRILSCDFPRGYVLAAFGLLLVGVAVGALAPSAEAGGTIAVSARVLCSGAAQDAERAVERLQASAQGTPAIGDFDAVSDAEEVEIHRDGAWIRLTAAPAANSDGKHWISAVYLSN